MNNITTPMEIFNLLKIPENIMKEQIEKELSQKLKKKIKISKGVWRDALLDTQRDIEINKYDFNAIPDEKYIKNVLQQILEIVYKYNYTTNY